MELAILGRLSDMNIFKVNKIINRLDKMIDNAINDMPIENGFDETKMSALETKLSHYLAMNNETKSALKEEKAKVSELISDISHQTKTPIANILLYSQLLEEANLQKSEKEFVSALVSQAEKLNFLISSLLKTSRLEAGIISLSPKENKIQSMIENVLHQAQPKASAKKISLTYNQSEITAVFDQKWTAEALSNIVDNAIKYTPCGGNVSISAVAYQLFCRIDIKDDGIGICESDFAKIFTRFYRASAVSDEEGVGIGLYLAREIIREQGGYIKVSSQLHKGSIFSIFLPMKS